MPEGPLDETGSTRERSRRRREPVGAPPCPDAIGDLPPPLDSEVNGALKFLLLVPASLLAQNRSERGGTGRIESALLVWIKPQQARIRGLNCGGAGRRPVGRIACEDNGQGVICDRGLEQNLVPVGNLVGVNRCGDAEGDNSKSEQQKATYARLHGILLCS